MKKVSRAVFCIIAAVITIIAVYQPAAAMQLDAFIVIGDDIVPLTEGTMPAYYGTNLYFAGELFSYFGMNTYYNRYERYFLIEYGKRKLTFSLIQNTITDEKNEIIDGKAEMLGSLVFVSVDVVAAHFGLTYNMIPFDPMVIIRVKNSREKLDDSTLLVRNSALLRQMYSDYKDSIYIPLPSFAPPVPTPTPSAKPPTNPPVSNPVPAPTPTPTPTYEHVTLSFSFTNTTAAAAQRIMSNLEQIRQRGLFYFTAEEAAAAPALIREIAGRGHSLGILLTDGTYDEYIRAKNILFEAAAARTPIIAADAEDDSETAQNCRELANEYGLIFRSGARDYLCVFTESSVVLPTKSGTSAELRIRGENSMWLQTVLRAANDRRYVISSINEISEMNNDEQQ